MRKIAEESQQIGGKIPAEQVAHLDWLADTNKTNRAWHIRQAIEEYLIRNPLPVEQTELPLGKTG